MKALLGVFLLLVATRGSVGLVYSSGDDWCSTEDSLYVGWEDAGDVDACLEGTRSLFLANYTVATVVEDFKLSLGGGSLFLEQAAHLEVRNASVRLDNVTFARTRGSPADTATALVIDVNSSIVCADGANVTIEEGANVTLVILKDENTSLANFSFAPFVNCSGMTGAFDDVRVENVTAYGSDSDGGGGGDSDGTYSGGTSCYRTGNYAFEFVARNDAECQSPDDDDDDPLVVYDDDAPAPVVEIGPIQNIENDASNQTTRSPDDTATTTNPANITSPPSSPTASDGSATADDGEAGGIRLYLIVGIASVVTLVGFLTAAFAAIAHRYSPLAHIIFPYRDRPPQDTGTV